MAKKCMVLKNERRQKAVDKYAERRKELKALKKAVQEVDGKLEAQSKQATPPKKRTTRRKPAAKKVTKQSENTAK